MSILPVRPLSNPQGDTNKSSRRMMGGSTVNPNNFNSIKYTWASSQYRQAVGDFWIPEEISLSTNLKDYKNPTAPERTVYDKILSFLVFLDSIQATNLPCIVQCVTANEVNPCLTVQGFQEAMHSQSYSYMLDPIRSPMKRDRISYQWKEGEHFLRRNTFIRSLYSKLQERKDSVTPPKVIMANYTLEGAHFYSGFMFFYSLGGDGKMPESVQEIRYINRDENTRLWLFRDMIGELRKEEPQLFMPETVGMFRSMLEEDMAREIQWESYVIDDDVPDLTSEVVTNYMRCPENLRWSGLGFGTLYGGYDEGPESMKWVNQYSNTNMVRADFFGTKSTAYAKNAAIADDLQI